jgi:hypothetical protein
MDFACYTSGCGYDRVPPLRTHAGWRVTIIAAIEMPGGTQMSEIRILVNSVPPEGWQWRLVAGGNTLKSGSAKTEAEAHQAANAALRRLQEDNRPTDTD